MVILDPTSIQLCRDAVPTLLFEGLHDRSYHAVTIFGGHAGAGWKAEAVFKEAFADFAAVHLG